MKYSACVKRIIAAAMSIIAVLLICVIPAAAEDACASGHSFVRNEAGDIAPTCTENGIKSFVCSRCGAQNNIVWKQLNHDYSGEWVTETEPNCTDTGVARRHCTRCDAITGEKIIPAIGHRVGEWEVVTPATCTENGTDICYCRFCDYSEERTTPLAPHTDEDEDHYCDICGARFGICICGSTVIHDQDNSFEYFVCLFTQIFLKLRVIFGIA